MSPRPSILILGPTAGGKTRLAIALAQRLPGGGTCISADSMQIYRGMDLGTAKPTAEERAAAPHELLDLVEPDDERFTVERWLALAHEAVARARAEGRWPIVVGGTNLYVKAFVDGLFEGPPPDLALREALNGATTEALRRELEAIDPRAAERIHSNDRRRTIRAIEVFRATGQTISSLQSQWDRPDPARFESLRIVGLDYPVESINRRINARVKQMLEAGLLEEVEALHRAGRLGRSAREALGYKQLVDHLEGRCSLEEAVEAIKIGSRRYAKQQRTWLRRFRALPGTRWFDAESLGPEALADAVLQAVQEHSTTTPSTDPNMIQTT